MLHLRLENIKAVSQTKEPPKLFVTEGESFRYQIAKTKPYKGNRISKKPWHFYNLLSYMKGVLGADVSTGLEADDSMAIEHVASNGKTILCSRDKDLRQIPGMFLAWELGNQPQYGPVRITNEGSLDFDPIKNKLSGTGYLWFIAQALMGDTTDNIPGLPKIGPKKAYELLSELDGIHPETVLYDAYHKQYGEEAETHLTEQAQLVWIVRKLNEDGSPQIWKAGMQ